MIKSETLNVKMTVPIHESARKEEINQIINQMAELAILRFTDLNDRISGVDRKTIACVEDCLEAAVGVIERELGVRFCHRDWYLSLGLNPPAELDHQGGVRQ